MSNFSETAPPRPHKSVMVLPHLMSTTFPFQARLPRTWNVLHVQPTFLTRKNTLQGGLSSDEGRGSARGHAPDTVVDELQLQVDTVPGCIDISGSISLKQSSRARDDFITNCHTPLSFSLGLVVCDILRAWMLTFQSVRTCWRKIHPAAPAEPQDQAFSNRLKRLKTLQCFRSSRKAKKAALLCSLAFSMRRRRCGSARSASGSNP